MLHNVKYIHIICTDPRIQKLYHDYLAGHDLFGEFDTIQYENPVLDFLNAKSLDKIIERIKTYRELHGAKSIVIFDHFDCGAYKKGGYKFKNIEEERQLHEQNNRRAVEQITKYFPDMEIVIKYIMIDREDNCRWWQAED
jgi:hypothetical protein